MLHPTHNPTLDSTLQLKDAGLVAADAATTVSSAAVTVDLGASVYQRGRVVIDVSAIETASNDESYTICVQASDSSSFASGVYNTATLTLGAFEVVGGSADSVAGRYVLQFDNVATTSTGEQITPRYLRLYTMVNGTIATGINYTAFMVRD